MAWTQQPKQPKAHMHKSGAALEGQHAKRSRQNRLQKDKQGGKEVRNKKKCVMGSVCAGIALKQNRLKRRDVYKSHRRRLANFKAM
jgi:hypothetical protein